MKNPAQLRLRYARPLYILAWIHKPRYASRRCMPGYLNVINTRLCSYFVTLLSSLARVSNWLQYDLFSGLYLQITCLQMQFTPTHSSRGGAGVALTGRIEL